MDIFKAHEKATEAAIEASSAMFTKIGGDKMACGFAWVTCYVDGRSKFAKELQKVGFSKECGGGYSIWNPSCSPVQNIDIKEAGAKAYAKVMHELTGVDKFYAGSRMD